MDEVREFLARQTETAKSPLVWTPVNLTLSAWRKRAGGSVFHQGTLIHTAEGIWVAGFIGFAHIGQKASDGSVDQTSMNPFATDPPDPLVIEYCDLPTVAFHGCRRLESGAIHCVCPDDGF